MGNAASALSPLPGFERDAHGKPLIPLLPASLYSYAGLIRGAERMLLELFGKGLLSGTTHTCLGQEFCQMAVVRALDDADDAVLSNHRNHGHFLTYSGHFTGLIAEVMGRAAGVCGGRGGSQHLAWRHFHSNGVQGGMTAIGAGLALARKWKASRGIVAILVGDGTLGQGLLYESLNLVSTWQAPALFVVEHNGIAQTTETRHTTGGTLEARGAAFGLPVWRFDDAAPDFFGGVERVVREVRESRRPGFLILDTERMGPHSKGDDPRDPEVLARICERDPVHRMGERLDAAERAAIDERNSQYLAEVRAAAAASPEARLDGRPETIYSLPARSGETAPAAGGRVLAGLNAALGELLQESEDVVLLGEDLHDPYGGAFKVTAGLSARYPARVISTPISEAGVVGAGIGLALAGYRPIVEIMFADFVALAMDQLYNHAVKFPGIFPGMRVPLIVRTPAGGRRGYGPTHSQSPEHLLTSVPGLTVVFPSPRHDAGALLRNAARAWPNPTVFLEHKLLYTEEQNAAGYLTLEAGDLAAALFPTLVRPRENPDVAIVAYGGMLPVVEKAAARLEGEEELKVRIVAPALLSPLPRRALAEAVRDCPRIVIAEEAPAAFGVGAEIAAALAEEGCRGRILRIGAPPFPILAARSLERQILPDDGFIVQSVLHFLTS
jgi:2-oxoisovalerate dehydrogenase E1 component